MKNIIRLAVCFIAIVSSCSRAVSEKEVLFPKITSENIEDAISYVEGDSLNASLHKMIMGYLTITSNYDRLTEYSLKVHEIGERNASDYLILFSSAYLSQVYFFYEDYEKCEYYLRQASDRIDSNVVRSDHDIAILVNNVSAGLSLRRDLDYSKAIELLKKSLDIIDKDKDSVIWCAVLCNISTLYESLNDTTGIRFAEDAYKLSRQLKSPAMHIATTITYSSLYSICKDYDNALLYAKEAVDLIERTDYSAFRSLSYLNLGNVYFASGQLDSAERAFDKALDHLDESKDRSVDMKIYTNYGRVFYMKGEYTKALELFNKADRLASETGNSEMRYKIYHGLSLIYERLGNADSAFFFFKRYHDAYNNATDFLKERKVNTLLRKYEQERHINEMREKEIELVKKDRTNAITLSIILILLIMIVFSFVLYRKRIATANKLIDQYQYYKNRINELKEAEKKKQDQASSGKIKLYEDIDILMKEKELFKDKNLSLNLLAEILKVSPSNISGAVNAYSGTTFPNYINSYRIEYVTSRLSDKNNTEPIMKIFEDAGFTSKATAYRSFQKEIGCSPVVYRDEMLKKKD